MVVMACDATYFAECEIVFSGLDADVAGDIGTYAFLLFIHIYERTWEPSRRFLRGSSHGWGSSAPRSDQPTRDCPLLASDEPHLTKPI